MHAHYLQHVAFEGLGTIEAWLQKNAFSISRTRFFAPYNEPLPESEAIDAIDFLIVMGGPMSVNDEHIYAWLQTEKQFIKKVIKKGKAVLGICLGAQLIASAMGARVFANNYKEIGWFPIFSTDTHNEENENSAKVFHFPAQAQVFHWHGEAFELPENLYNKPLDKKAVRLAASEGCPNQAFQLSEKIIGLQFHLEVTAASVQEFVKNSRTDITGGKFVATPQEILANTKDMQKKFIDANKLMEDVLLYLQASMTSDQ